MRVIGWSGPRNLSTALMYSFGNRADFEVMDEPFYAAYLARTGLEHPMREAILASQSRDPAEVAALCARPPRVHSYQKHMAHHMEGVGLDWTEGAVHLHLIRHPARVIASYGAKRDAVTEADLGFAAYFLTVHDLVKFARARLPSSRRGESLERVRAFVTATRPAPAPVVSPDAPPDGGGPAPLSRTTPQP